MVKSLLDICAESLATYADNYLGDIRTLPAGLKDKLLQIMTFKGTVTDMNIGQLLHPGIRKLDLRGCHVSDLALRQINCPQLKIILVGCQRITSEGVMALGSSCPSLRTVDLGECDRVTDEGVTALAHSCTDLEVVSLRSCSSVGDAALLALAGNCRLHTALLSGTQITDKGIAGLVGLCSNTLHELHVARCPNLTDEAVKSVFTNCPHLRRFVFNDCPQITEQCWASSLQNFVGHGKVQDVTWTVY